MKRILTILVLLMQITLYAVPRPQYYYNTPQNIRRSHPSRPYQRRVKYINVEEQQAPGESLSDFCRRECAKGRSVSRECCIKCNSCQAYSDEGASECRDYPY